MEDEIKIPENVEQRMRLIEQKTGIDYDEIKSEYLDILKNVDSWEDCSLEEKHSYASTVLWTRYISRPPVRTEEIIPIGYSPPRITRTGVEQANLFALVKGQKGIKRIVLRGGMVSKLREITLLSKYSVKLGRFSSGDYVADNRAKFEDPVMVPGLTFDVILDKIGAKRVTIKEAVRNPSKQGSDGYIDQTDWRIVRGVIIGSYRGLREDGTEWARYIIADDSIGLNEEPTITSDGRLRRPGMTVWVAPEMLIYQDESECDFVGTVSLNKDGDPFMNCYLIVPIHAREV